MTQKQEDMGVSLTENAMAFIKANKRSPVVSGYAIEQSPHKPSRGASYTLKNGKTFLLSAEDCKAIGMPRWAL